MPWAELPIVLKSKAITLTQVLPSLLACLVSLYLQILSLCHHAASGLVSEGQVKAVDACINLDAGLQALLGAPAIILAHLPVNLATVRQSCDTKCNVAKPM